MFFVLSKVLDVLVEPLVWAVVLVLLGTRRTPTRLSRAAPLVGVALLLLFASEPIANALVRSLEAPRVTLPAGRVYDAVVLLGGPVEVRTTEDSGMRSFNEGVERMLVAAELLRDGRARDVVISGGRGDPETHTPESHVLRDELVALGIDPGRIVLEERSRNTHENAEETKRIAEARGYRSLLLVTSAFHMPRAHAAFEQAGLHVDTYPCDYRSFDARKHGVRLLPRAGYLATSTYAIREHLGRIVYALVARFRPRA